MKQRFLPLFLITISISLNAQKHDYMWLLGYDSNPTQLEFGGTVIDFNTNPPDIFYEFRELNFDVTNANISDEEGNILFYTNGISIMSTSHELMENGDSLNWGEIADGFYDNGYILEQGALILPLPNSDSLFYLFHATRQLPNSDLPSPVSDFLYSIIDITENNGKGKVLQKNEIIVEDTLSNGKITATKHANGRDWWILIQEYDNNRYYRFMLTPDGIVTLDKQIVEPEAGYGQPALGQAVFSPDGSKYIRHEIRGFPIGHFIDIYDFDRCSGLLSNNLHIVLPDTAGIGGVAVSPNSRFLYVSSNYVVYQLDLWSNDIEASKTIIAEYDGFMSPFSTRFYLSQLAPNGKIYINSSSGTNVLHVINSPNQPKELSDLRQHDIQLPTFNKFSLPNFPNYRLGALDGSLCDTLGINNHPLAGFTCEPESLTVTFSDNSYYAPTDWFWDFGDNGVSNEQNPIYSYSEEGTYEVCLTVSNDFDSDTFYKTVTITTTNTKNLASDISFELYPNPTSDKIFVSVQSPTSQRLSLHITNLFGDAMKTVSLSSGMSHQEISLEELTSGTYFYQLYRVLLK